MFFFLFRFFFVFGESSQVAFFFDPSDGDEEKVINSLSRNHEIVARMELYEFLSSITFFSFFFFRLRECHAGTRLSRLRDATKWSNQLQGKSALENYD